MNDLAWIRNMRIKQGFKRFSAGRTYAGECGESVGAGKRRSKRRGNLKNDAESG